MTTGTLKPAIVDADGTSLYRVGGLAAIAFGIAYVVIFPLYASVGAPPDGGEAWLSYADGKTAAWWAIVGLSVLTDFLLVPITLALYLALKEVDRNGVLLAMAFVAAFVVLDLAVTWPNLAVLISLTGDFGAAASDARRAAIVAAAEYPSAVLSSTLAGVYSIATLSVGILMLSHVMLRSAFSRTAAFVGVATGTLGIISVAGPFVVSALGLMVILASVLTTVWAFLVGHRLYRLGAH